VIIMTKTKISDSQRARVRDYRLFPRKDVIDAFFEDGARLGRFDWELAPILAEKLRHLYPQLVETKYPQYKAAMGQVFPIDSSPGPAAETWRQYQIDFHGKCQWIDDDMDFSPSNAVSVRQSDGRFANFGQQYDITLFDMERAAAGNVPLASLKGKMAKRAHEAWKNWMWLFGDADHELSGLCNHPNIIHHLAAFDSTTGNTSRLWANKSDDDIYADVKELIDSIPQTTLEAYECAKVFMPPDLMRLLTGRFVAATATGTVTLWDRIKASFPSVTFDTLNECQANRRLNPDTGTDTSGISGDFLLALPADSVDEIGGFMSARPFSQLAPQQVSAKIRTITHEKIGGVRLQQPKAIALMRFGTT
jgi:hypothetical protein